MNTTSSTPTSPAKTATKALAKKAPAKKPAPAAKAVKPATKTAKAVKAPKVKAPKLPKAPKVKTPKVKAVKAPKPVHDSYTLPKDEYAALTALKTRSTALGQKVKKNELLRAGLLALGKLGDAALLDALRALPGAESASGVTAAAKAPVQPTEPHA
jgi:uncharacterized membrane protein